VLIVSDDYERWFTDGHKERRRNCRSSRVVYRSVVEDNLMFSIVIRVCLVYGFRSNLEFEYWSCLVVTLFKQGININPMAM